MARRILGSTQYSMKVMVYGKPATRKSNIGAQFARLKGKDGKNLKVLLIDTEYKAIEGFNENYLVEQGVDTMNILEERTRNLENIQILIDRFTQGKPIMKSEFKDVEIVDPKTFAKKVVQKEVFTNEAQLDADGKPFVADVIVIDSLSVISDMYTEGRFNIVERRTNIKIKKEGITGDEKEMALENMGLQLLDYSKLSMQAKKMIRDLLAVTGKHVVFVCRAKDAKETVETIENGKKKLVMKDLGYDIIDATSFKFLGYETNLNLHTKKTEDGAIEMTFEKDCTGIHKEGDRINHFDIMEYQAFINNESKSSDFKVASHNDNIESASSFTEESSEVDAKFTLHKTILEEAKKNVEVANKLKQFCADKGINGAHLGKVELLSMDMLLQMKETCL
ncbi:MAG: hypothetical protein ACRDDY_04135 [Clostridium sp.]|uniref:hypothetical protein n=1 Tax=Clostridium sp. TaxID=1506 RepID=UPI003EE7A798